MSVLARFVIYPPPNSRSQHSTLLDIFQCLQSAGATALSRHSTVCDGVRFTSTALPAFVGFCLGWWHLQTSRRTSTPFIFKWSKTRGNVCRRRRVPFVETGCFSSGRREVRTILRAFRITAERTRLNLLSCFPFMLKEKEGLFLCRTQLKNCAKRMFNATLNILFSFVLQLNTLWWQYC